MPGLPRCAPASLLERECPGLTPRGKGQANASRRLSPRGMGASPRVRPEGGICAERPKAASCCSSWAALWAPRARRYCSLVPPAYLTQWHRHTRNTRVTSPDDRRLPRRWADRKTPEAGPLPLARVTACRLLGPCFPAPSSGAASQPHATRTVLGHASLNGAGMGGSLPQVLEGRINRAQGGQRPVAHKKGGRG
jgi:hypothetical protein